jgi:hypothetical protein
MPAKAGIQNYLKILDSRPSLRWGRLFAGMTSKDALSLSRNHQISNKAHPNLTVCGSTFCYSVEDDPLFGRPPGGALAPGRSGERRSR